MLIRILKAVYFKIEKLIFIFLKIVVMLFVIRRAETVLLWAIRASEDKTREILKRAAFYIPDAKVEILSERSVKNYLNAIFSDLPMLVLGSDIGLLSFVERALYRCCGKRFFNVDYEFCPSDGWVWHDVIHSFYPGDPELHTKSSSQRFFVYIQKIREENLSRAYIFGTGPSLSRAMERDWSDGYRIVCNTIVRDQALWSHLRPHFVVAGDAIYHFGHARFARAFREDLRCRLRESEAMFLYPELFYSFVRYEFSEFSSRLIPVPVGHSQDINPDLTKKFLLPGLGNVLPLLLLPLGCTLSKNVYLCGFDGRAPKDKLFWSNSSKHTYPEYMDDLQKAHPAFFGHHLDKNDAQKYVKTVHGDVLDMAMRRAEKDGWKFIMMHPTWTPTLQKRYDPLAWAGH